MLGVILHVLQLVEVAHKIYLFYRLAVGLSPALDTERGGSIDLSYFLKSRLPCFEVSQTSETVPVSYKLMVTGHSLNMICPDQLHAGNWKQLSRDNRTATLSPFPSLPCPIQHTFVAHCFSFLWQKNKLQLWSGSSSFC